jgi:hypothetical protein
METEQAQNLVGIPALTSLKFFFVGILDQTSNFAQKRLKNRQKIMQNSLLYAVVLG